jgi:hypothetical protein
MPQLVAGTLVAPHYPKKRQQVGASIRHDDAYAEECPAAKSLIAFKVEAKSTGHRQRLENS